MKKLTLALAAIVLFTGVSFAQSSTTATTPTKNMAKYPHKTRAAKKAEKKADKPASTTPAAK